MVTPMHHYFSLFYYYISRITRISRFTGLARPSSLREVCGRCGRRFLSPRVRDRGAPLTRITRGSWLPSQFEPTQFATAALNRCASVPHLPYDKEALRNANS